MPHCGVGMGYNCSLPSWSSRAFPVMPSSLGHHSSPHAPPFSHPLFPHSRLYRLRMTDGADCFPQQSVERVQGRDFSQVEEERGSEGRKHGLRQLQPFICVSVCMHRTECVSRRLLSLYQLPSTATGANWELDGGHGCGRRQDTSTALFVSICSSPLQRF